MAYSIYLLWVFIVLASGLWLQKVADIVNEPYLVCILIIDKVRRRILTDKSEKG